MAVILVLRNFRVQQAWPGCPGSHLAAWQGLLAFVLSSSDRLQNCLNVFPSSMRYKQLDDSVFLGKAGNYLFQENFCDQNERDSYLSRQPLNPLSFIGTTFSQSCFFSATFFSPFSPHMDALLYFLFFRSPYISNTEKRK